MHTHNESARHDLDVAIATSSASASIGARLGTAAAVALPFLPAAVVLCGWVTWISEAGAYYPRDHLPWGVLFAVLLGLLVVGGRSRLPSWTAGLALALIGGWVAVNGLSILWAGSAGSAWEATTKLLVVFLGAAILALTPWTPRVAAAMLGLWAAAVAIACGIDLLEATRATSAAGYVLEDRYLGPLGYANGSAALPAITALVAVALSSRPQVPWPLRPLLLGLAAFLVAYALIPQSRASMLSLVIATPVLVLVSPNRVRLLGRLAVVGGTLLFTAPASFAVFTTSVEEGDVLAAIDDAARAAVIAGCVALAAGFVLVALESVIRLGPRGTRALRVASVMALVTVVLGGGAVGLANRSEINTFLDEHWQTFKGGEYTWKDSRPRLETLGRDNRYDYWKVAVDSWKDKPVLGIGAGNFERTYTAERAVPRFSRYVHDIWLRALGETGIVGLGLLVGFWLTALVGLVVIAARRRADPLARGLAAASAAVLVYFAVHASFDWLEELVALAGPVIGLPFIVFAAAAARRRAEEPVPVRTSRLVPALVVAGCALSLLALVPSWLAVRYTDRALAVAATDSAAALRDLDRASSLNRDAIRPHLTAGGIALRAGNAPAARRAFTEALAVEDHWLPHFQLSLLDAQAGRFGPAGVQIRRAMALDANDPLLAEAAKQIKARRRIDPLKFNQRTLQQPVFAAQPR